MASAQISMSDPHSNRGRPALGTSRQKVAPSLLIFVALHDKSLAFVPLDVKKRVLVDGVWDRSDIPDGTRPTSREDLRRGRNRGFCPARDEREPKRVLEIDAHASVVFQGFIPPERVS